MPVTLPPTMQAVVDAIDYEAQQTLAHRLQEALHSMEAGGLGPGQAMMQQLNREILGQANRDKMRVINESALERWRICVAAWTLLLGFAIAVVGLGLLLFSNDAVVRGHGVTIVIAGTVVVAGVSSPLVSKLLRG